MTTPNQTIKVERETVDGKTVYAWSVGDKGGYCATEADAMNDATIARGVTTAKPTVAEIAKKFNCPEANVREQFRKNAVHIRKVIAALESSGQMSEAQ